MACNHSTQTPCDNDSGCAWNTGMAGCYQSSSGTTPAKCNTITGSSAITAFCVNNGANGLSDTASSINCAAASCVKADDAANCCKASSGGGGTKTCANTDGAGGGVFNCGSHANDIHASPAGVTCATSGCTETKCCTVDPNGGGVTKTCANTDGAGGGAFNCGSHANDIHASPAGVTCADTGCTETKCCTVSTSGGGGTSLGTSSGTSTTSTPKCTTCFKPTDSAMLFKRIRDCLTAKAGDCGCTSIESSTITEYQTQNKYGKIGDW